MTNPNCGDTCGLIDFTMAIAGDRLLPEERMKLAIEAVTSEKMSQRAAAAKFEVAQRTLSDRLARMSGSAHPTETQSTTEVSAARQPSPPVAKTTWPERYERRKGLRKLATEHGIKELPNGVRVGKSGERQLYDELIAQGIEVPEDIIPISLLSKKSKETNPPAITSDATQQPDGIQATDHVPDQEWAGDSDDDDPLLDERIDVAKLNQRILDDVNKSDRPDSFKRSIQLLTELEQLVVTCWYGRDNWSGQDWVHVNSQVKAIQSLAGQRAKEAHSAFFQGCDSADSTIAV